MPRIDPSELVDHNAAKSATQNEQATLDALQVAPAPQWGQYVGDRLRHFAEER